MTKSIIEPAQNYANVATTLFTYEVSDEALEATAYWPLTTQPSYHTGANEPCCQ